MDYQKISNELNTWNPKEYFKKELKRFGGFNMVISGNTRAGKTNTLSYLLKSPEVKLLKHFDFVVVFSKTLVNGHYAKLLNSKLLFSEYNSEVIQSISKKYDECASKGKHFKTLFIFDDILDGKSKYQDEVNTLFMTGRHRMQSCIYSCQKICMLSTAMRTNTMVFLLLFCGSRNEREFLSQQVVSDMLCEKYVHLKKNDIERLAYLLHAFVCQDYNALVCLPYEKDKLQRYKAGIVRV